MTNKVRTRFGWLKQGTGDILFPMWLHVLQLPWLQDEEQGLFVEKRFDQICCLLGSHQGWKFKDRAGFRIVGQEVQIDKDDFLELLA